MILFFAVLLVFSVRGFLHLKLGLDLQDLAPKSSYLRAFDNQLHRHFNTFDIPADIFFSTEGTPWWSSGFLAALQDLESDLIGAFKFKINESIRISKTTNNLAMVKLNKILLLISYQRNFA